jgi:hypothetical protein
MHRGAGPSRSDDDEIGDATHPLIVSGALDDLGADAARIAEGDGEPRPRARSEERRVGKGGLAAWRGRGAAWQ